jgi:hypothetical protein
MLFLGVWRIERPWGVCANLEKRRAGRNTALMLRYHVFMG